MPQDASSRVRTDGLTHLDAQGRACMVDVGAKAPMARRAVAEAFFCARAETIDRVVAEGGGLPKGEALCVARIAGIQAAKRCDELIPLCHSLPLDAVGVDFERSAPDRLRVVATASTTAKTGVEMEAIVAASIAAITLYDMAKGVDKELRIEGVRLVEKTKSQLNG
ncbi:MAG: cyclic pyranopterin monophosphate synthase MoaC [Phycisphaeraceae bacterium]|nr:MAG: cyclic pyranopterin monophosphate synthase MoaC [Phycisphaeraceae bacterium]